MTTFYNVRDGETKELLMVAPMSTIRQVLNFSKYAVARIEQEQQSSFSPATSLHFNGRAPVFVKGDFVWIELREGEVR